MKLLKKILEGNWVLRRKVRSRSEKGKFHIVGLTIDGDLTCDCMSGSYGNFCRHKKILAIGLTKAGVKYNVSINRSPGKRKTGTISQKEKVKRSQTLIT